MKRVFSVIVFSALALLCAFADETFETVSFQFRIRKYVETTISLDFVQYSDGNTSAISNSTYAINLSSGIDTPQIALSGTTNMVSTYTILLSFSPMTSENQDDFKGLYDFAVFTNPDDLTVYTTGSFDPDTREDASISFAGVLSDSVSTTADLLYPISFDYTNYLDEYDSDDYTGTITRVVIVE